MMKKILSAALILCLSLGILAGCDKFEKTEMEYKEIVVFAAASMQETLSDIAQKYTKNHDGVEIVFNFDSSGTLKTQIEEGAECHVFVSAAQKQMNELDDKGLINAEDRFNVVSNKCVLIVPAGNPAKIRGFDDVASGSFTLMSMGNSDVPAGQYGQQVLESLGAWDKLNADGKLTFASNVREVLAQVEEGAVDCGIVYSTDAMVSGNKVEVIAEAPEGSHDDIIYPACTIAGADNYDEAKDFLEYLRSEDAKGIFEKAGFSIPE
ncbi:MAG: molybdate ABC transporter substrate-binding protein [Firmicutes bacterium]|nr:molybdate ABC transporter substrate-binding protein [Bacillota bacterium]MBR0104077.1 molybdate ABC transporter substrate-binding protein [Bacillota bacterium]